MTNFKNQLRKEMEHHQLSTEQKHKMINEIKRKAHRKKWSWEPLLITTMMLMLLLTLFMLIIKIPTQQLNASNENIQSVYTSFWKVNIFDNNTSKNSLFLTRMDERSIKKFAHVLDRSHSEKVKDQEELLSNKHLIVVTYNNKKQQSFFFSVNQNDDADAYLYNPETTEMLKLDVSSNTLLEWLRIDQLSISFLFIVIIFFGMIVLLDGVKMTRKKESYEKKNYWQTPLLIVLVLFCFITYLKYESFFLLFIFTLLINLTIKLRNKTFIAPRFSKERLQKVFVKELITFAVGLALLGSPLIGYDYNVDFLFMSGITLLLAILVYRYKKIEPKKCPYCGEPLKKGIFKRHRRKSQCSACHNVIYPDYKQLNLLVIQPFIVLSAIFLLGSFFQVHLMVIAVGVIAVLYAEMQLIHRKSNMYKNEKPLW